MSHKSCECRADVNRKQFVNRVYFDFMTSVHRKKSGWTTPACIEVQQNKASAEVSSCPRPVVKSLHHGTGWGESG
ncbi:Hypothetical predicted protein [Scomber scombrus]|uniref:Uncharacterized protein n=1 Tax=Scomber scombrus TaxID=13677 RepID=A0AAV1N8Q4_SCOSC